MRTDNVNGAVLGTDSSIKVGEVVLRLSFNDAYALCNMLTNKRLDDNKHMLEKDQVEALRRIGRDVGILIDHPSRDNLGKFRINVEKQEGQ